jgi:hypothetical protein
MVRQTSMRGYDLYRESFYDPCVWGRKRAFKTSTVIILEAEM